MSAHVKRVFFPREHKKLVLALKALATANWEERFSITARERKYSERAKAVSAAIAKGEFGCYRPWLLRLMRELLGEPIPPLRSIDPDTLFGVVVKVLGDPNGHNYPIESCALICRLEDFGLRPTGTMGNHLPLETATALEVVRPDSPEFEAYFAALAKARALPKDVHSLPDIDKFLAKKARARKKK